MARKRASATKMAKAVPTNGAGRRGKARSAKSSPVHAPGSPQKFRARVRMYRQGLGDCFLVTFPRGKREPFQILIDCGVLTGTAASMIEVVKHIRDTIRAESKRTGKARIDLVVGTHEHKDHLSGFNQARDVFNSDFEFGAVWLGWTENLTKPEIKKIKEAKRKAVNKLRVALNSQFGVALDGVESLLAFSEDDDVTGTGKIADALEYLKLRGKESGELLYLEPGIEPIELDGLPDLRVYVLGPPRDPLLLKGSEVTEQMKQDDVVYHLGHAGEVGIDSLAAALSGASLAEVDADRFHPFAIEHRVPRFAVDPKDPTAQQQHPFFPSIAEFVSETYDSPDEHWRRIDDDWLAGFGQLALALDNDTNNTSLVLAFEFVKSKEVLLFVGDAQVGNWRSWAGIEFQVPGRNKPLPALDLLRRTVFYKVGHHCSHNATLKEGGLELMTSDELVAFIPLDKATARKQGKKDPISGVAKGWDMPARPLFKALNDKTSQRVVLSDVSEPLPIQAKRAGVVATGTFIDYFLK